MRAVDVRRPLELGAVLCVGAADIFTSRIQDQFETCRMPRQLASQHRVGAEAEGRKPWLPDFQSIPDDPPGDGAQNAAAEATMEANHFPPLNAATAAWLSGIGCRSGSRAATISASSAEAVRRIAGARIGRAVRCAGGFASRPEDMRRMRLWMGAGSTEPIRLRTVRHCLNSTPSSVTRYVAFMVEPSSREVEWALLAWQYLSCRNSASSPYIASSDGERREGAVHLDGGRILTNLGRRLQLH